ncbi:hypothetical protein PIB30_067128 [Stylosanthes scabra]|uniref:Uncharacterized protein n=1 Tax=Stylosanthes scabra TaxID=79078 RepID=A0ABU6TPW6_9FABA|nr:hypothetical protein [Stylosanthes scabra]
MARDEYLEIRKDVQPLEPLRKGRKQKKQRREKPCGRRSRGERNLKEEEERVGRRKLKNPSNPTAPSASETSRRSFSQRGHTTQRLNGIVLRATSTTREARNVGLPEFGATVPDIGPGRPNSIMGVIEPQSPLIGHGPYSERSITRLEKFP